MRCPYCAEDVKDEALVCKHCQRELFVVKPLLAEIAELKARLAALQQTEARAEAQIVALEKTEARAEEKISELSRGHRGMTHFAFGFGALLSVVIGYMILIGIHYTIIVKWDVKLIYYQFTSIAVPVLIGLLYRPRDRVMVGMELLMAFVLAIAATASELGVISYIDNVPFWPKSKYEWNEVALHSASIMFGLLAGVMLRNFLEIRYLPNAKLNQTIDWTARFIVNQFGDGKRPFNLKTIRSLVSSVLGFSSAIVSIATGLWEYWLK